MTFRLITKIRGALISVIYHGMLSVRAESNKSSAGVALMGNEVDRITYVFVHVVSFVPSLVQVALAIWILSRQLGAVCVAPIIVALSKSCPF